MTNRSLFSVISESLEHGGLRRRKQLIPRLSLHGSGNGLKFWTEVEISSVQLWLFVATWSIKTDRGTGARLRLCSDLKC